MILAVAQMDVAWGDREANYARARALAEGARGADLLLLPEMFATGFCLDPRLTAEPEDGPSTRFLSGLARDLGARVLGGVVWATGSQGRNMALGFGPDGTLEAAYQKTHLFSFAGEQQVHAPGRGLVPWALPGGEARAFICYDLRFPELFREGVERTSLYLGIASWPAGRQRHWDTLLPARALENLAFVVGCNRVGEGGGLTYSGGSGVWGPQGDRLAWARDQEGLITVEISLEEVATTRARLPFLEDRR